jgi:UDP-N-acetylglucosamine 2-epimerase
MNDTSKNGKKALILAYTKEDVINSLTLIKELEKNGSKVIVLGLDFHSWMELRRRSIRYKTPADYLDKRVCAKIDTEAICLAREWYKSINDKIMYHGISLGEMQEYNFAFLFIDALRDIEIANSVINIEKPDEVWLPANIPVLNANAVRYEALPKAMIHKAKARGINVSYNRPSFVYGKVNNRQKSFIKSIAIRLLYQVRKLNERVRLRLKASSSKHKIVFVGVPSEMFSLIKTELEKNKGNVAINIHARMTLERSRIPDNRVKEMTEIWKDLECNELYRKGLIYNTIPLVEIMHERFYKFFSYESLILINYIEETEKFIRKVKPDIVIVMEDISPIYRVITRVCKQSRIPTLVIQHGILAGDMKGFDVMPIEADKQAVWGDASKKWAVERGKPSETQVVTGNPRFDPIVATEGKSEREKRWVYDKLGLTPQKGIVVLATSWYAPVASCYVPEEIEVFVSKTLEAMKEFPEKQVVVKLHPAYREEYEEIARAIANELQIANVFITHRFLWELLSICDLLITDFSTVGLEGMLFDKPVIIFSPMKTLELNRYAGSGAALEVYEEENLVPAIKGALYDKEVRRKLAEARNRFIYEYAYLQDGKASQRVANLIEQMIEESKMNSCVVPSRK